MTRSTRIGQPIQNLRASIDRQRTSAISAGRIARPDARPSTAGSIWNRADAALERGLRLFASIAPTTLRLSLALVFFWFGILKVAGVSPVAALVAATLPWANPSLVVHLLGVVEVGLAIGLLVGKAQRWLLLALAVHLSGTFLTFVMAPSMTMRHGDPFLLTADGEFVLKNFVLISAALFLASHRYVHSNRARMELAAD